MKSDWPSRFADNVRDYEGYPIGKTLQYLTDPEIISLAGGLPSPEVFQRAELRLATEKAFDLEIDRIMQYSPCPGEATLVDAVLRFLERDSIHIGRDNIVITTSGQHGLDLTGRLFLEPGDTVLVDRPTFAGVGVVTSGGRASDEHGNLDRRQSSSAIGTGSMLTAAHQEASSPYRCSSRWWSRQTGTVYSSLTLRPSARGWANRR